MNEILESICALPQPPPDFDPLQATPADLKFYGLPPRPENPKHASRWEQLMSKQRGYTFIKPTFKLRQRPQILLQRVTLI